MKKPVALCGRLFHVSLSGIDRMAEREEFEIPE
jgi:hypothetical protein